MQHNNNKLVYVCKDSIFYNRLVSLASASVNITLNKYFDFISVLFRDSQLTFGEAAQKRAAYKQNNEAQTTEDRQLKSNNRRSLKIKFAFLLIFAKIYEQK